MQCSYIAQNLSENLIFLRTGLDTYIKQIITVTVAELDLGI